MSEKLPQSTPTLVHRLRRVAKYLDAQTRAEPQMAARANTCWQAAGRLQEQYVDANSALSKAYYELIYAVESAFPGESRHATALRYIRMAEQRSSTQASAARNEHDIVDVEPQ